MQPWERDPFVTAIREDNLAAVKRLLARGRTPHERFHFRQTPLHVAAQHGAMKCVSILLKRGAELEALDEGGWSPLVRAVQWARSETTAFLLKTGARMNYLHTPDDSPESRGQLAQLYKPIFQQARESHPELTAIMNLPGLDFDQKEFERELVQSMVETSVQPREIQAIHHCRDLLTLKLLVEEYGADVNTHDGAGYWPLKLFAEEGNAEAVAWLLAHGAKPDYTHTGDTALHKAVLRNRPECVRLLLEAGANANQQDVDLQVPLAHVSSATMLDLLLSFGADPNIPDQCNFKPSYWVKDRKLKARLKALERKRKPRKTAISTRRRRRSR
jgi:uncharacterized protein